MDILELHEFEVVGQGSDGQEAVAQSAETDPEEVVMDLRMPPLDGLKAARRIRDRREDPKAIHSADLDDDVRKEADDVGVAI